MNPGFLSYGGSMTTPEYSLAVGDPAENGLNAARTAGPGQRVPRLDFVSWAGG